MKRTVLAVTLLVGLSPFAPAESPTPVLALKGLDPVALVDGKEVAGRENLEVVRGLFRYHFETEANKRLFEAKPEEYGVQFNGACGKMGPFGGTGSPDRFHIHNRRIYVFASEGCRTAFKGDPEKHIERPNPAPEGSAEQEKRGAELVRQALVGFGGAVKVDAVERFQAVVKHVYKQGGTETIGTNRITWMFPSAVRIEDEFSKSYGFVVRGAEGFQFAGKEIYPLDPAVRDVGWRQALREPLAMLRNRTAKGFVAVAKGPGKVVDTPVELLAVALDGATSTWAVEPTTGRILQVTFEARHGTVGENVVKYGDFRSVDGLTLPHRRTSFFNGKERTSPEVRIERFVVNGTVEPGLFEPSK